MGLFGTKHITLEKVFNNEDVLYFLDYGNLKKPLNFIEGLLQYMAGDKPCLIVIDTNIFYIRSKSGRDEKIQEIIKELDKHELKYRDLITQEDSDNKILGIKMQNNVKVNCHKIGIVVEMSRMNNILAAISENNAFCYIIDNEMQQDEVLDKFIEAGGGYEGLSRFFRLSLYFDTYFQRVRVHTNSESTQIVEEKLNNYKDSYVKMNK